MSKKSPNTSKIVINKLQDLAEKALKIKPFASAIFLIFMQAIYAILIMLQNKTRHFVLQ